MAKSCPSGAQRNTSGNTSRPLFRSGRHAPVRFRYRALALAIVFLPSLSASICRAQNRDVVCRDGDGGFQAVSPTGVKVRVGPPVTDGLAARACEATLSWGDQKLEVVAAAAEVDIDAFGVDLGLGAPVIALQVKKSKDDCCMEYDVYSLREPPTLLRRITGGAFYSAADTDLDGRIEIWTDDAAALDGFENLRLRDFDFAPPVVLRFARGRLMDASAEFRSPFDAKIAGARAKLVAQDLYDFKNSDGKLADAAAVPSNQMIRLKSVKVKVLAIVLSYLHSGREQEAWRTLADMWPAADFDRIRAALINARARGIRSQVDGVSIPVRPGHENHAKIFDGTLYVAPTAGVTPKDVDPKPQITPPRAILMERQPPMSALEAQLARTESQLEMVIDSAGKVRSVEEVGQFESVDEGLLRSTSGWKFIPAFDKGQPVASRILLGVSLRK
jgi:hypothetical protein